MKSALIIAGLLALGAPSLSLAGPAEDAAQVGEASAAWDGACKAGDLARLAERYEEGAVSMPPGAPALVGRAAIVADFDGFLAKNRGEHHTLSPVRVGSGDLVVERAFYHMTITPKDGAPAIEEAGKHIVVYHRQSDGSWKVASEIWNAGQ